MKSQAQSLSYIVDNKELSTSIYPCLRTPFCPCKPFIFRHSKVRSKMFQNDTFLYTRTIQIIECFKIFTSHQTKYRFKQIPSELSSVWMSKIALWYLHRDECEPLIHLYMLLLMLTTGQIRSFFCIGVCQTLTD